MTDIVIVIARADNGAIGNAGGLPWRLPADLKRFKALTLGKPVLMGRRTWDAIGRPLPGRRNLVMTHDPAWAAEGAERVGSLDETLVRVAGAGELMVIGGAQLCALAMPRATRIELTQVNARPEADTFLIAPDPADWRETWREEHSAAPDRPAYAFIRLERVRLA